jgi:hypothetical protein
LRGSTAADNEEVLFRVKVSDVGLQNSSLINGKQPTDWVEIRLPGHLYDPPKRLSPVSKQAANWNTPIDAAVADFSRLRQMTRTGSSKISCRPEGKHCRSSERQKCGAKNKALFGRRTNRFITGEADYKEYSIVFVRDSGQAHPLPLVFKKNSTWIQKNECPFPRRNFRYRFSALYNGGNLTIAK